MTEARILFDRSRIEGAAAKVPSADFAAPQYDCDSGVATRNVLLLLSTPRSGSTLLCELLRQNGACLPHEYFQPAQYMPLLADRWGCLREDTLDEAAYVDNLRRYRTFENGWLGVNLHGAHLRYFVRCEAHLADTQLHYVHLIRRDVIAQAVSYHIATQTGQWSSHFAASCVPQYSYEHIKGRLERIHLQNALIQSFVLARKAQCITILYEDLVRDPDAVMSTLPCVRMDRMHRMTPTLKRQSDTRNAEWTVQFAREMLYEETKPVAESAKSRRKTS